MSGNDRSKICEHCKHWGKLPVMLWGNVPAGWRLCLLADGDDGSPETPSALAFAHGWHQEQEAGSLITAPTFGCVQFEAKQ